MKTEVLGIIAGVLTASSLLPQLIKIIKEKKAEDLSLGMLFTLMTGQCLWVYYGVIKNDWPIIATNIFSILVNIAVVILSIKFKNRVSHA